MWWLPTLMACFNSGPGPEPVPRIAMEGRFALSPPATGSGTVVGTWLAAGGKTWIVGVQAPDGTRRAYRVGKGLEAVELEIPESLPKGAWFGMSAVTAGPWAVISAPGDPEGDEPGTLEVYEIGPEGWAWVKRIEAEGASAAFGLSLAASGERVVAADREAGLLFVIDVPTWEIVHTVTPSVGAIESLALDDDTLLAGAPSVGAVLVLRKQGDGWVETGSLPGPGADGFGAAVALRGARAVVGAPAAAGGDGAVFIYTGGGGAFTEVASMGPEKQGVSAQLGSTVGIVGDTVLAGAPGDMGDDGHEPGVIEAYAVCEGKWGRGAALAGVGAAGDGFGAAIALAGDTLLAASPNATASGGRRGRVDGMRIRPARCVIPKRP